MNKKNLNNCFVMNSNLSIYYEIKDFSKCFGIIVNERNKSVLFGNLFISGHYWFERELEVAREFLK